MPGRAGPLAIYISTRPCSTAGTATINGRIDDGLTAGGLAMFHCHLGQGHRVLDYWSVEYLALGMKKSEKKINVDQAMRKGKEKPKG